MEFAGSSKQSACAVFMVRPAAFRGNPETVDSNAFQACAGTGSADCHHEALAEFETLVETLLHEGVRVHIGADTARPVKPDACFPNNWVSFHDDGVVVLYPMHAPSRRLERRAELLEDLATRGGYLVSRTVDLTAWEQHGMFLEGTGSMVLDRVHRVAYACRSPRTMLCPLNDFAERCGYEALTFEATDAAGRPIYHTNVMMSLAGDFAALCLDALPGVNERQVLCSRLEETGHDLLILRIEQIHEFAGNMLALENGRGDPLVVLSSRARAALTADQRTFLERRASIVSCDVATIERIGGGSVRCMLAEVFLPRR
ncbi:MAG: arginine deiminase-related protein [Steroidobacteraceae bacterium]